MGKSREKVFILICMKRLIQTFPLNHHVCFDFNATTGKRLLTLNLQLSLETQSSEKLFFPLYSHGHNILRHLDILPNFCFATSGMKCGYY